MKGTGGGVGATYGINNLTQEQGQGPTPSPSPQADPLRAGNEQHRRNLPGASFGGRNTLECSPAGPLEVPRSGSSCQRHSDRGSFPSFPSFPSSPLSRRGLQPAPSGALLLPLLSQLQIQAGILGAAEPHPHLQESLAASTTPGAGGRVDKLITCLRRAETSLN